MCHVMRFNAPERSWEVGYFQPDGVWKTVEEFDKQEEACREVNFLNGGPGRRGHANTNLGIQEGENNAASA